MKMPEYVLTENGNIKVKDGKPLVKDGDKEYTVDAIGAQEKITTLNGEAAKYRRERNELRDKFEPLKDIEDVSGFITEANKNKAAVADFGDKENTNLEALHTEYKNQLADKDKSIQGLETDLFESRVKTKFATSEVIGKTVLPPDIAYATFKSHFALDGTAKDAAGNQIFSKEKPGEPAGFDEAMTHIIDNYPNKESIMKPVGIHGGDSHNTGPGDQNKSDYQSGADLIKSGLDKRN